MSKKFPIGFLLLLLTTAPVHAFKCVPIYGNWCGPNHPASGFAPPPVDEFDAACMRHDYCTQALGNDAACDVTFINEIRATATRMGGMPREIQWAEYAIRVKAGGAPWQEAPMPNPFDAMGMMGSLAAPCP